MVPMIYLGSTERCSTHVSKRSSWNFEYKFELLQAMPMNLDTIWSWDFRKAYPQPKYEKI